MDIKFPSSRTKIVSELLIKLPQKSGWYSGKQSLPSLICSWWGCPKSKGLDIYYWGEGDGSKRRKIRKFFVDPPNSSENFSQTPAKDPIIFTDSPPPQFHRFYKLSTGRLWGHLVIFHRPPCWEYKMINDQL